MSAAGTLATAPPAPPAAPRVHRTELLRGAGVWVGAVLAVSVIVAVLARRYFLFDTWATTQATLRGAGLILGGPLALTAGCWQGGREGRRGTGDLLASAARSPLRRALTAALPSMAWPVLGYLAATAVCLGVLLPYPSYGHPAWHLPAVDAVALGSLGALGFAAGRAVPWRFSPPLVGVAGYVLLGVGVSGYTGSGTAWLSPANKAWGGFGDVPVWWAGVLCVVWTAGLAAAALLAGHARRRALAVLPLLAAVAAGSVLYGTGDGLLRSDSSATALVCDRGTPAVCVRTDHAGALPAVRAVVTRIDSRLAGAPGAPVRYREGGTGGVIPPGEVRFELYGGVFRGRLGDPEMLYRDFVFAVTMPFGCEGSSNPAGYPAEYAVQEWLDLGRPLFADTAAEERHAESAARRLRALAPAERRAWLGRYLVAARSCDTSGVPAP
ncbi:hypothetical protein [Actinacidiphila glaucinigra]|uniref:hypothetical protein n=1 Tax=Actinacidiphila glaucinigra TaxID=235986 RepID=UPI0035DB2547